MTTPTVPAMVETEATSERSIVFTAAAHSSCNAAPVRKSTSGAIAVAKAVSTFTSRVKHAATVCAFAATAMATLAVTATLVAPPTASTRHGPSPWRALGVGAPLAARVAATCMESTVPTPSRIPSSIDHMTKTSVLMMLNAATSACASIGPTTTTASSELETLPICHNTLRAAKEPNERKCGQCSTGASDGRRATPSEKNTLAHCGWRRAVKSTTPAKSTTKVMQGTRHAAHSPCGTSSRAPT
mmetsp:Transcript_53792/g.165501  ORF Transcript_53792/g.165501 Transcript_53792/m.165501 type:complete len:243 (-) Transcript_53792:822-1550(-)